MNNNKKESCLQNQSVNRDKKKVLAFGKNVQIHS